MAATTIQASGAASDRERLITEHLSLVRQVAQRFYVGPSSPVELGDILQYGVMGLIDATEKYDPSRGTSFQSYARFRIKGSILDGLRHLDFLPRSVRRKRRQLLEATQRVEQELGGVANADDVAEALELDPGEYQRLRDSVQGATMTSVEELTERGAEAELTEALSRGREAGGPEEAAQRTEVRRLLVEAIDELPEKERLVLSLYYYESCTMREVGEILGVTESRVSQLHAKAVRRLEGQLREPLAVPA